MRVTELQKKILKAIRGTMTHKDLCSLCTFSGLTSTGVKRIVQDRLEIFINSQPYNKLVQISNKIDEFSSSINENKKIIQNITDTSPNTYIPDCLTEYSLSQEPIDLSEEVSNIDTNNLVILEFTNYPNTMTPVPTKSVSGINERAHIIRLPNMLPHVPVEVSPFYCGVVCLHPLSLMVPTTMPNIPNNNKIISHNNFQFVLSEDVFKLLQKNSQMINNKIEYKWQILLRFVVIDPTNALPEPGQSVMQQIPPYLSVTLNREVIPLWEILPSNSRQKEGKRHTKPVNVTDKLNTIPSNGGYKQSFTINWWQIPGIFQYYYVGVYLERKLSVHEILDVINSPRHVNDLPIDITLRLIKSKLNDSRNHDDEMVVSSLLPINLSCPVGRGRIQIPIRTLRCQHIQCFDAHLFLSMNERRSVWKCPVCDISSTPKLLFCDKFFQSILENFKDNNDINEINVSSDGSYVAVIKGDDNNATEFCEADDARTTNNVDTMIVLDSDEDDETVKTTNKENRHSTKKLDHLNGVSSNIQHLQTQFGSETQRQQQAQNPKSIHISYGGAETEQINPQNQQKSSIFNPIVAPTFPESLKSLFSVQGAQLCTPSSSTTTVIQAPTTTQSIICAPSPVTTECSLLFKNIEPVSAPIQSHQTPTEPVKAPVVPIRAPVRTFVPPVVTSLPLKTPTKNRFKNKQRANSFLSQNPPYAIPLKPTSIETSIKATTWGSILPPVAVPAPPSQSWNAIPAPAHVPLPQAGSDPSLSKVVDIIPAIVQNIVQPELSPLVQTNVSTPKSISANEFESMFKFQRSERSQLSPSIPKVSHTEVVRTIQDVVRTLPTDPAASEQPRVYKNLFSDPIVCPAVILDNETVAAPEPMEVVASPQMSENPLKSDAARHVQPNEPPHMSAKQRRLEARKATLKVSQAGVMIPEVKIDLTEEDEEDPPPRPAPSRPTHAHMSMLGPYSSRTVLLHSDHRQKRTVPKGFEIDLTADDDDDDQLTSKKQRMVVNDDSDSESSETGSSAASVKVCQQRLNAGAHQWR